MNSKIQEVILGSGLGELKFGMTRDQVKDLVGSPDDVEKLPGFEEEVNDELESWHYDEHEFSLVFDSDFEWKLVSIAVSDPFFTLKGKSLVGMEKQDLLDYLDGLGIVISATEDLSDDENPGLELIESEESGMMVWFVNDEVIEIQILPEVEEDGETLIWPN